MPDGTYACIPIRAAWSELRDSVKPWRSPNPEAIVSKSRAISVFETGISRVEMRIAPRFPILQRCFVHPLPPRAAQPWRCIAFNVSKTGVGVTLPFQLPEGTLLTIEAWNLTGSRPLQARVIHSRPVESLWFTGCELVRYLSDDELDVWCSGPTDWVESEKS